MGRKTETTTQTQAAAGEKAMTAEEQRAAGMGGSYFIDPKAGTTELVHRTEEARYSRKEGLKEEDDNGQLVPVKGAEAPASAGDTQPGSEA